MYICIEKNKPIKVSYHPNNIKDMIQSMSQKISELVELRSQINKAEKRLSQARCNKDYYKFHREVRELYVLLDVKLDLLKISTGAVLDVMTI